MHKKPTIAQLYDSFNNLKLNKKTIHKISNLPIPCFTTKHQGKAVWIISGIHGEEPAGPIALSNSIHTLNQLSKKTPLVILPLCNPIGYVKNWRYLNMKTYSRKKEGLSIGDSEYLLLDKNSKPRKKQPSSKESKIFISQILKLTKSYPPKIVLNLHEDNKIHKGYIYSQGQLGEKDKIARFIIKILSKQIPIQMKDKTRFKEVIKNGIIENIKDGSIDELLASKKIITGNKIIKGPGTKTVIVIEIPSEKFQLNQRVNIYKKILKQFYDYVPGRD